MRSFARKLANAIAALPAKTVTFIRGVSWRRLIFVQRIVFERAIVALPLIGLVVAASPQWISNYVLETASLHFVYWGALIFLAAQVMVWQRQPIEFKGELDVRNLIGQIKNMTTTLEHCQDRAQMLRSMCERATAENWPGLDQRALLIATKRSVANLTEKNWEQELPGIETSIRELMDYSNPKVREQAVWISVVGTLSMMFPTITNALCTGYLMICSYFSAASKILLW